MRGSGPRGAGHRRTQGGGGGDDTPRVPASLAGCYSAPLKGPLWTCLLLCAALRTLLASPSNEGREMEVGTKAPWGGWVRWSLCQPVAALQAPLRRLNPRSSSPINVCPLLLAFPDLSGIFGCIV